MLPSWFYELQKNWMSTDLSRTLFFSHYFITINPHVKLWFHSLVTHITNFTKNLPFLPVPVMDASDAPGNSYISVRITAIKLIFIIKIDSDPEGLFRRLCPLQNFLRPFCPFFAEDLQQRNFGFKGSIMASSNVSYHTTSLCQYGRLSCTLFLCPVFGEYFGIPP